VLRVNVVCKGLSYSACRFHEGGGSGDGLIGGGVEHQDLQKLPISLMLTFGACSGLVAQTVTYPLDVVRRQMQVPTKNADPLNTAVLSAWLSYRPSGVVPKSS